MKDELLDDLALLAEGDAQVRARHAEALAADVEAADLLHDAEGLTDQLRHAGADYRAPEDLEAKLFAALDARSAGDAPGPKAEARPGDRDAAPTRGAADAPSSLGAGTSGGATPRAPRRIGWFLAGIAASAAAVGGGFAWRAALQSPATSTLATGALPRASAAWSGRVAWVSPAPEGLRIEASAGPSVEGRGGARVPVGARLRTDARTRARITLEDGSVLDLDRDTELSLEAGTARAARLLRGTVLASVARAPGSVAKVAVAHGTVEVVGTSFRATSTPTESSVEVLRGHVVVHTARGDASLEAGREAILRDGRAPRITYGANLGRVAALSEQPTAEQALVGLGELRARRPGERAEQERPLRLASTNVTVDLVGSVARTTVEQAFQNDDDVTLEGVYRFPLPDGARIAKLALEVEGRWEEGAFVDKTRAERIFQGVLRHATPRAERRDQQQQEYVWVPGPWRDPALLEWQRGGRVELRIFPIPARAARRVRITYEERVPTDGETRTYVYPFASVRRGEAKVDALTMAVRVHGRADARVEATGYPTSLGREGADATLRLTQQAFAPSGPLVVRYPEAEPLAELRYAAYEGPAVSLPSDTSRERPEVLAAQRALAADGRGYVAFTLRPELATDLAFVPSDVAVVVDSSQSMTGDRFVRARGLVAAVLSALDPRHRVTVLACDADCVDAGPLRPATEDAAGQLDAFLAGVRPAGSTDVARALATAGARLPRAEGRSRLVLYVGDGSSSVGATTPGELEAEVARVASEAGVRVSTVALGDDADARALAAAARAGGGVFVPYAPGRHALEVAYEATAATRAAVLEQVSLELPAGLEAPAPAKLPNLAAGAELVVAARVVGDVGGDLVLRGVLDGRAVTRTYPVQITRASVRGNAFVPRIWATERIAALEAESGTGPDTSQAESVALSRGYGVLSRGTALLVLESEAMFRAFGVDRASTTLELDPNAVYESSTQALEDLESTEGDANDLFASALGSVGEASRSRNGGYAPEAAAPWGDDVRRAPASPSASASGGSVAPAAAPAAGAGLRAAARDEAPREAAIAPPPPGPGRWARRVRIREASIAASSRLPAFDPSAAASRLAENPESRDRLRDLVTALVRAGDDRAAAERVDAWLVKDPSDADALARHAELIARAGKRAEAVRVLSGLVDATPNDARAHERLVAAYEAIGDGTRACRHRRALARIAGTAGVGTCAATPFGAPSEPPPVASAASGNVVVEARSDGDVDLVLVSPSGVRSAWFGGRRGVRVERASDASGERLVARSLPVGTHHVEVVSAAGRPVSGTLRIRAYGVTREVPFRVESGAAVVAKVVITERVELRF